MEAKLIPLMVKFQIFSYLPSPILIKHITKLSKNIRTNMQNSMILRDRRDIKIRLSIDKKYSESEFSLLQYQLKLFSYFIIRVNKKSSPFILKDYLDFITTNNKHAKLIFIIESNEVWLKSVASYYPKGILT
jgi:hypothetical protein